MRQRLCIRCKEAPDGAGGTYLCQECLDTYKKTFKKCSVCTNLYPRTEEFFYEKCYTSGNKGLRSWCKNCEREYDKTYRANHKEQKHNQGIKDREIRRQRYFSDEEYRARVLKRDKEKRKERRIQVLSYYGEGLPKCACCGESNVDFLELDHIDGNGGEHRQSFGQYGVSSNRFFSWVIRNNFPQNLQVLCANCHLAKTRLGYCPHTLESSSL